MDKFETDKRTEHRAWAIVFPRPGDLTSLLEQCLPKRDYRVQDSSVGSETIYPAQSDKVLALMSPWRGRCLPELAPVIAKETGLEVRLYEVLVREEQSGQDDDVAAVFTSFSVDEVGVRKPLRQETQDVSLGGDFYEMADQLMRAWLEDEVSLDDFEPLDPLNVARQASELPSRLQELARQIRDAGAFTATKTGERFTLRIALPDGSRRISFLSSEELGLVEAACPGLNKS